jgi:hypothetical protein
MGGIEGGQGCDDPHTAGLKPHMPACLQSPEVNRMSTRFSLSSGIQVFPCPNCRETINTSMAACTFCGTPIDRSAAVRGAYPALPILLR